MRVLDEDVISPESMYKSELLKTVFRNKESKSRCGKK